MQVASGEACPRCETGELVIATDAVQDPGAEWTAHDGDAATCDGCGFVGWVSVDDGEDSPWINWLDADPDPADPGELDGDHATALESVYGPEE